MSENIASRVAVVTGVGRAEGLGFEVCRQLADQGITVFLTSRSMERAALLADCLTAEAEKRDVRPFELDVTRVDQIERLNGVLINAVCPGFTATFPGAEAVGARPVKDGATGIVWAALLPAGAPTGGFFRDGKPLPW